MGSGADKIITEPEHYTHGNIQPLDVIEDWDLPFHLASVIKYIARYRYKGNPEQDLEKAREYITRFLEKGKDNEQTEA